MKVLHLLFTSIFMVLGLACSAPEYRPLTSSIGIVPFDPSNPYHPEVVALGKLLFFDTRLSGDGKTSCATCHRPTFAFSDYEKKISGDSDLSNGRNTPPLFNLAWQKTFFWDGGSTSLEAQSIGPFQHKNEMHIPISTLLARIQTLPEYSSQIQKIWKKKRIEARHICFALAQYQRTLVSLSAPYDTDQARLQNDSFYLKGLELAQKNCFSCHPPPLFTDGRFHNNGLDSSFAPNPPLYESFGRYRISNRKSDMGAYKTPSLRNLSLTAPYMHDGRFQTLEAVMEHYSTSIKHSSFTDTILPNFGFRFSQNDINAMVYFLQTLNDSIFLQNQSALSQFPH